MAESLSPPLSGSVFSQSSFKQQLSPNHIVSNDSSPAKDITITLVLGGSDMPSPDLPLRHHMQPHYKEQRKSFFRRRFWALAGSNDFGGADDTQQGDKPTVQRMIYVPKHAATDFSAMSPGPLRTSSTYHNPKSSSASSRASTRMESERTTPATEDSRERRFSISSDPGKDKQSTGSREETFPRSGRLDISHGHVLKRSISNISFHARSHNPLPTTHTDFALFAAQTRSGARSADTAAAWSNLVELQDAQRRSHDNLATETRGRPLSLAFSDGSVSARRRATEERVAVMRRIQMQHAQQAAQAQKGLGHRIVAYIRPQPRVNAKR